jgi:SAM-dependent methyltransferase
MRWRGPAVDTTTEALVGRHAVDPLVLDQVRVAAWDRLLFVECGDGWLVEEAWRRMRRGRVWGLSTSPPLIALAVQLRGIPGLVEFMGWDGERFPLPDGSIDSVISCVPLIRYLHPVAVLSEMARVLRPDGDAYLFESDRATAADLGDMLAASSLKEVGRSRCEAVLGGQEDGGAPAVVHVRRMPDSACASGRRP